MKKKQEQGSTGKNVGFGKNKDKLLIDIVKDDLDFFKQIKEIYYSKYDLVKKKYYDKLEKKYIEENGLSNTSKSGLDMTYEVVSLMKERYTSSQLTEYLSSKYKLNIVNVHSILSDANTIIRKEFESEKSLLLDLHLLRYEEIFIENLNVDLEEVPAGYRKALKCEHMITAMETLFQKERLLGVHTKAFKLKANESILSKKEVEFDTSILNKEEKIEVFNILGKAKAVEKYNKSLLANNNPLNINTKTHTIDDDTIESPIKKAKQTDLVGERENAQAKSSGKTLIEVQESLGNTLKDKVRELFEKKNKKT